MSRQTDQEERRGLIASFFGRAPSVPQEAPPQPAAVPTRHARRERRAPDPTPAEEAAMRRRAREWQESYDRMNARQQAQAWRDYYAAPSGTCTPSRCHITGHRDDAAGHEQYRPGLFRRLFGRRDNGIG